MGEKSRFKVADTSSPDAFKSGSPTNFRGVLESIYVYPYVGKESKDGKYYGFLGYKIVPHPDSGFETFTKKILAFYLNSAVPSKDGETAAGGNDDLYRMLSNGKAELDEKDGPCVDEQGHVRPDHPNVGEYLLGSFIQDGAAHQLFDAFKDCDEKGEFLDNSIMSLNKKYAGLECHWDLVPPRPRKGGSTKKDGKDDSGDRNVLVATKIFSKGNKVSGASAGAGAGATGKSTASTSPSNGSETEDNLVALIKAEIPLVLKAVESKQLNIGDTAVKVSQSLFAKKLITKAQKAAVHNWILQREPEDDQGNPGLPLNLIMINGADWDPSLFNGQGGLELA